MPSLRIPNERKGIVDLYDVSDDWIPIYDRSVLDGFYMAIGTERQPVQERPGRRPPHGRAHRPRRARPRPRRRPGPGPLRLQRGIVLDGGFYSRLREVNPNSSFSVNG
jgi:sarcosine oxidase subunit beta